MTLPDPQRTHGSFPLGEGNSSPSPGDGDTTVGPAAGEMLEQVGPYRLLSLLGEGGFGMVYLAEQERPIRRRVALKLVKPGMDSRAVIARFEAERQALAMMDHPNVARVYDAGTTPLARPYFVMELVKGDPITAHCDRTKLDLGARLALFLQVCAAIQHAHQKGIIHRDLKPSNILVEYRDGVATPKVIDFGVAKALHQPLTDSTLFTHQGQLIGTPEYMSPEQAEMSAQDIDTRTDIYSLGVILYELVTGTQPLDSASLRSAGAADLVRAIRERDPVRPSLKLTQISRTPPADAGTVTPGSRRGPAVETRILAKQVRGDLDWIIMKALEKDRTRRYDSAGEFADDIRRFQRHEPVRAGPPTAGYRVRKFAARNRGVLISAGLVAVSLVGGLIAATYGLLQARDEARRAHTAESVANERLAEVEKAKEAADRALRVSNAVTTFFTQDVLDLAPTPTGVPEPTVRSVLEGAEQKIDKYFKQEPAVEGTIRERIGQLYLRLGEPRRAADYLVKAVPLIEAGFGAEHASTLAAQHRLGELLMDLRRYDEAAPLFRKTYTARTKVLGPEHIFTINSLMRSGAADVGAGRGEEGLRTLREARDRFRALKGPVTSQAVTGALDLAAGLIECRQFEEAASILDEQRDLVNANASELGQYRDNVLTLLGDNLRRQGRYAQAVPVFDDAEQVMLKSYPASHPAVFEVRRLRGLAKLALGELDASKGDLEPAYESLQRTYGRDDPRCREIAGALADIGVKQGDPARAEHWREAAK